MRVTPVLVHKSLLAAALVVSATLAGCAGGPSDFLHLAKAEKAPSGPVIRDANQQAALAAALAAQSRGGYRSSSTDQTSMMALSVVRDQQTEQAQALLQETGTAFGQSAATSVCDPYSVDPKAACPAAPAVATP